MFHISNDDLELQKEALKELSKTSSIIYFDQFVESLAKLYKHGDLPDVIRIAKDEDALLAGDFEPAMEINLKENMHLLYYNDLPMWHNQSSDEFSLHGLGLIEGNKSKPSTFTLYDTNPHGNIGGATGHGKSVLANDLLISASLVHPPWLVQYYLSDPKITEMKPYALSEYKLPHVDAVAATEDPEYAISMLEYILEKMDKRGNIYANVGVKNIKAFNKKTGLTMPMMVLVLDELKAMLQTAGRRASHVDKLIQAFVAKARFAGGRCIMLSQGVVTELDKSTMDNVNIRMALGCTPAASEKLVGNPGASVNLGQMGKIAYNDTPDKKLEDNVYFTSPFLPDEANEHTNNIYDIFEHQQKVWEQLTYPGARVAPLSFFDQTAPLTKEYFKNSISGTVAPNKLFIGEPVYISKAADEMAYVSFEPADKYSDNLANNLIFFSNIAKERLNFLETMLINFDELKKVKNTSVVLYASTSDSADAIRNLGHDLNHIGDSSDVSDAFARAVQQTLTRIVFIRADKLVFSNDESAMPEETPEMTAVIKIAETNRGFEFKGLFRKRAIAILHILQEPQNIQILELGDKLSSRNDAPYLNYVQFADEYFAWKGCDTTQYTHKVDTLDIRIFYNFSDLNGTETKTNRSLDMWMTIVKQAPLYGVHFFIITGMLPSCGSSLNGNFDKIVFFQPTSACVGQFKLGDDYPPSTLDMMYVFADKSKTINKCVKIKKVSALD